MAKARLTGSIHAIELNLAPAYLREMHPTFHCHVIRRLKLKEHSLILTA